MTEYLVVGMIFLSLTLLVSGPSPRATWTAAIVAGTLCVALWPLWLIILILQTMKRRNTNA